AGFGVAQEDERVQQPVHVDLTVGHAAEARVPLEVFDLVEVETTADEALERTLRAAADESLDALGHAVTHAVECRRDVRVLEEAGGQSLVVAGQSAGLELLESVGERVMPHVVEEPGEGDGGAVERLDVVERRP